MSLREHELKSLAIELASAMPPLPTHDFSGMLSTSSAAIDGVADILGTMIGEVNDMDGRLFACVELLKRISREMDAHV